MQQWHCSCSHIQSVHICVRLPGLSLPISQRCMWVDCGLQLHLLLPHVHQRIQGECETWKCKCNFYYGLVAVRDSFLSFALPPAVVYLTGENRVPGVALINLQLAATFCFNSDISLFKWYVTLWNFSYIFVIHIVDCKVFIRSAGSFFFILPTGSLLLDRYFLHYWQLLSSVKLYWPWACIFILFFPPTSFYNVLNTTCA